MATISQISGWGNYPEIAAEIHTPARQSLQQGIALPSGHGFIPRGAARSYGDSALAHRVLSSRCLNRFISFDNDSGLLTCDAGVTLGEILTTFVPKGWFLPVTPGTKFITVGGAVASDVHGKNHHLDGCFSEFVTEIIVQIGDQVYQCSRQQYADLFHATCGGMGLTGLITQVSFSLKPIKSAYIRQKNIKTSCLAESLRVFDEYVDSQYSVAWIDCLATGEALGRSIISVGEHADQGALEPHQAPKLSIPCHFPDFVLNPLSVQAFNFLYYGKEKAGPEEQLLHYNPYFYPLDGIANWNRMYGRGGFTQYQFALPKTAGLEGLSAILDRIAKSKQGSFLAVLKAFGKHNNNPLSFPVEGYTLALDFKINARIWSLLNQLDEVVIHYGGRLYLTKDARMTERFFKATYPRWQEFNAIRDKYGATQLYSSLQSQRLGISR